MKCLWATSMAPAEHSFRGNDIQMFRKLFIHFLMTPENVLLACAASVAADHGRQPAPLNDNLNIFSNNFLDFYNIINIIILNYKLYYNYNIIQFNLYRLKLL